MILNANCGKREFVVPADLATGDYLIRAEVIALHAAGSPNGAQLYMTCYQVHVEGTGSATPQGVTFPGAYKATDPGILINIYGTIDDYIVPGPEIYKAGGSGGAAPAPAPVTTVQPTPVPATTAAPAPVATSSKAVVSQAPSSTIAPVPSATSAPPPVYEDEEDCEEL